MLTIKNLKPQKHIIYHLFNDREYDKDEKGNNILYDCTSITGYQILLSLLMEKYNENNHPAEGAIVYLVIGDSTLFQLWSN